MTAGYIPPDANQFGDNHVVSGDFDNDGKLDVAVTANVDNTEADMIDVLLGNGDGTLGARVSYPTTATTYVFAPFERVCTPVGGIRRRRRQP